jgi:hypothetical protein
MARTGTTSALQFHVLPCSWLSVWQLLSLDAVFVVFIYLRYLRLPQHCWWSHLSYDGESTFRRSLLLSILRVQEIQKESFFILKMEIVSFFKIMGDIYQCTRRHITEDLSLICYQLRLVGIWIWKWHSSPWTVDCIVSLRFRNTNTA